MTISPKHMALILGWGGVIPFIGAALVKNFGGPLMGIYALNSGTIYAGVIISFIGAVHWGYAIHSGQNWRYFWSVLPALAVVLVLSLAPILRVPFLILGLAICWIVDMITTLKGGFPKSYMTMRHGLTAVAITSLGTFLL